MAYIELVDRSRKQKLLQSNLKQRKKTRPGGFFIPVASPLIYNSCTLFVHPWSIYVVT